MSRRHFWLLLSFTVTATVCTTTGHDHANDAQADVSAAVGRTNNAEAILEEALQDFRSRLASSLGKNQSAALSEDATTVLVRANSAAAPNTVPKFEFMPHFEQKFFEFMVPEGVSNASSPAAIVEFIGAQGGDEPRFRLDADALSLFDIGMINAVESENYIRYRIPIVLRANARVDIERIPQQAYLFKITAIQNGHVSEANILAEVMTALKRVEMSDETTTVAGAATTVANKNGNEVVDSITFTMDADEERGGGGGNSLATRSVSEDAAPEVTEHAGNLASDSTVGGAEAATATVEDSTPSPLTVAEESAGLESNLSTKSSATVNDDIWSTVAPTFASATVNDDIWSTVAPAFDVSAGSITSTVADASIETMTVEPTDTVTKSSVNNEIVVGTNKEATVINETTVPSATVDDSGTSAITVTATNKMEMTPIPATVTQTTDDVDALLHAAARGDSGAIAVLHAAMDGATEGKDILDEMAPGDLTRVSNDSNITEVHVHDDEESAAPHAPASAQANAQPSELLIERAAESGEKTPADDLVQDQAPVDFSSAGISIDIDGWTDTVITIPQDATAMATVDGVHARIIAERGSNDDEVFELQVNPPGVLDVKPHFTLPGQRVSFIVVDPTAIRQNGKEQLKFTLECTFAKKTLRVQLPSGLVASRSFAVQSALADPKMESGPRFSEPRYEFHVAENASAGALIGQISVDAAAPSGQRFALRGKGSDRFRVNDRGEISLAECPTIDHCLDAESVDKYHVVGIAATNDDTIAVPITIHVDDVDDNAPTLRAFDAEMHVVDAELARPFFVLVADGDVAPANRRNALELDGSAAEFLAAERVTDALWQVRPAAGAAAADAGIYTLLIRTRGGATNDSRSDKDAVAQVTVTVKGESPQLRFGKSIYERTIASERLNKGNPLVQLELKGAPTPPAGGAIVYTILGGNPGWMAIESYGGQVYVGDVPRQSVASGRYVAIVGAVERDTHRVLAKCQLAITVVGSPQNVFTLDRSFYSITGEKEGALPGKFPLAGVIGTVAATTVFKITADSVRAYDKTGKRLAEPLPFTVSLDERNDVAVASRNGTVDGALADVQQVFFQLQNTDNERDQALVGISLRSRAADVIERLRAASRPKFAAPWTDGVAPIKVRLPEEFPQNHVVLRLPAHNPLTGRPAANYSLSGAGARFFSVDEMTGTVQIAERIDYESLSADERRALVFEIHARSAPEDGGAVDGGESSARVEVQIFDVDDASPVIHLAARRLTVAESARVGATIVNFTADDVDSRRLRCAFAGGSADALANFKVVQNEDEYAIVVAEGAQLDRETTDRYALAVGCVDPAGNRDQIELVVEISDENDNRPLFTPASANPPVATAYDNWPAGVVLARLEARDRDSGNNAQITYSLSVDRREADGYFDVDNATGVVRSARPLAGLPSRTYALSVTASDGGTPPFSSTTRLDVSVRDAASAVEFDDATLRMVAPADDFVLELAEDTPIGRKVFTVEARLGTVGRAPSPANVSYGINPIAGAEGESSAWLRIDSSNGDVFVAAPLDYERQRFVTNHHVVYVEELSDLNDFKNHSSDNLDYRPPNEERFDGIHLQPNTHFVNNSNDNLTENYTNDSTYNGSGNRNDGTEDGEEQSWSADLRVLEKSLLESIKRRTAAASAQMRQPRHLAAASPQNRPDSILLAHNKLLNGSQSTVTDGRPRPADVPVNRWREQGRFGDVALGDAPYLSLQNLNDHQRGTVDQIGRWRGTVDTAGGQNSTLGEGGDATPMRMRRTINRYGGYVSPELHAANRDSIGLDDVAVTRRDSVELEDHVNASSTPHESGYASNATAPTASTPPPAVAIGLDRSPAAAFELARVSDDFERTNLSLKSKLDEAERGTPISQQLTIDVPAETVADNPASAAGLDTVDEPSKKPKRGLTSLKLFKIFSWGPADKNKASKGHVTSPRPKRRTGKSHKVDKSATARSLTALPTTDQEAAEQDKNGGIKSYEYGASSPWWRDAPGHGHYRNAFSGAGDGDGGALARTSSQRLFRFGSAAALSSAGASDAAIDFLQARVKETKYVTAVFESAGNGLAPILPDITGEFGHWLGTQSRLLAVACEVHWSVPERYRSRAVEIKMKDSLHRALRDNNRRVLNLYDECRRGLPASFIESKTEESCARDATVDAFQGIYRRYYPDLLALQDPRTVVSHRSYWTLDALADERRRPLVPAPDRFLQSRQPATSSPLVRKSVVAINMATLRLADDATDYDAQRAAAVANSRRDVLV